MESSSNPNNNNNVDNTTNPSDGEDSDSTFPRIYAAPTTETIDGMASWDRMFDPNMPNTTSNNTIPRPRIPVRQGSGSSGMRIARRKKPSASKATKIAAFQRPCDWPTVRCVGHALDAKSVFAVAHWPTIHEWESFASKKNGSNSTNTNLISPSRRHLQVLRDRWGAGSQDNDNDNDSGTNDDTGANDNDDTGNNNNNTNSGNDNYKYTPILRQVQFSPSTGRAADWLATGPTMRGGSRRDGRYRRRPVRNLPQPAPRIGKNTLLPTRADVGLPGATPEEVAAKHQELRLEVAWEECSPRLVAFVPSAVLGTAVESSSNSSNHTSAATSRNNAEPLGRNANGNAWNAGGLPHAPLAGPELVQAVNPQQWMQQQQHNNYSNPTTSALAPPLDAVGSKSQGGWKSRPYLDRPPHRTYALAKPQVTISSGNGNSNNANTTRGLASLTLYRLHNPTKATATNAIATTLTGKMSEALWFPTGHWDAQHVDLRQVLHHNDGATPASIYNEWKSRQVQAILSFDNHNDGSDGDDDTDNNLVIVLQLWRSVTGQGHHHRFGSSLWKFHGWGVAPLSPDAWPNGQWRQVPLYQADPAVDHDEAAFVQRLQRVVDWSSSSSSSSNNNSGSGEQRDPPPPSSRRVPPPPRLGDCQARIFTSILPTDFLQVMLQTPPELQEPSPLTSPVLPKLLADISGDFAVVLDPQQPANLVTQKRSDLLRLPRMQQPAGYVASCLYRELLALPMQADPRQVDPIAEPFPTPNFLFVTPRKVTGRLLKTVTVRVGIVAADGTAAHRRTAQVLAYNPTPWVGGAAVVEHVFTTVGTAAAGACAFRDEIKLRLPALLDGSFRLQFSLFALQTGGGGGGGGADGTNTTSLQLLAETIVPLCRPSSAEDDGVTTVIPNGHHQVRIGEYQLEFATRLYSAIHVGDPAVAGILRDFPYTSGYQTTRSADKGEMDQAAILGDAFCGMLQNSSATTLMAHFQSLLYMHFCNLVNIRDGGSPRNSQFLRGNMASLFVLLSKVRKHAPNFRVFFKYFLDLFDESCLSPVSRPWSDKLPDLSRPDSDLQYEQEGGISEEPEDTSSIVRRSRKNRRRDSRVDKIVASLGHSGMPLSRAPYVASREERMLAEAEQSFGFFDDDETIATMSTRGMSMRSMEGRFDLDTAGSFETASRSAPPSRNESDVNSIVKALSRDKKKQAASSPTIEKSEPDFADRVRTAAQVMLAPCVGNSLSSALGGDNDTKRSSMKSALADAAKRFDAAAEEESKENLDWWSPGTDDEADAIQEQGETSPKEAGTFRGPPDAPLLLFSVKSRDGQEVPVASGDYLYESLMVLWLRSWLDFAASRSGLTFPIPSQAVPDEEIYLYYANMDILLPLCLKSMVLRYSVEVLPMHPPWTRGLVDESHMLVMEPFVEMLARGLVGQALGRFDSPASADESISRSLESSDLVLDFLVGLVAILHPEHIRILVEKYFKTLTGCETEHLGDGSDGENFQWTAENLHRVRCSRQLRIRAVEVFASVPAFLSLNFPVKCKPLKLPKASTEYREETWMNQFVEEGEDETTGTMSTSSTCRFPSSNWLSDLLLSESLLVCSLSCEAVVFEAMAHDEITRSGTQKAGEVSSALKKRPGASLKRNDLLMFQSISIHAITCVYELMVRRHAMDARFQTRKKHERISSVLFVPILNHSIQSVRWLARMESTHKVRTIWLLCFLVTLQEAPESLVHHQIVEMCKTSCFIDLPRHAPELGEHVSPWLLQESFNILCAVTIIIVETCSPRLINQPDEQGRLTQGILDLLLHILTTPQSAVTQLRAVGAAIQALETFGIESFTETLAGSLQHWLRVVIGLMNSTSLSVRSITVDFTISMLSSSFDKFGTIDDVSMQFTSVLPEVVAREIALFGVNSQINEFGDVHRAVWPLRRSLSDIHDANPLDDDRVDPYLSPILERFCGACQATIDGVIIELTLRGNNLRILGCPVVATPLSSDIFTSIEESLFEAANFYDPESFPIARFRWLLTLRSLHLSNGRRLEAAESIVLGMKTVVDAMPVLKSVWRPTRYTLWSDSRRSLWLDTVGEEKGVADQGNRQVMDFAAEFLEPRALFEISGKRTPGNTLQRVSVPAACETLMSLGKEAANLFLNENQHELAMFHFDSLSKQLRDVWVTCRPQVPLTSASRRRFAEDSSATRRLTEFFEKSSLRFSDFLQQGSSDDGTGENSQTRRAPSHYFLLSLRGKMPQFFFDNGRFPTFLEWNSPCVLRMSGIACPEIEPLEVARPYITALEEMKDVDLVVETKPEEDHELLDGKTYLRVFRLVSLSNDGKSKRFVYSKGPNAHVEVTVGRLFPCAVSRQRVLVENGGD